MATITTRAGKGSPLTNSEVDANFSNLNTDKLELGGGAMTGAITTNSTFDGRDVSVDGAKLDTVAASANNYTHPSAHAISFITGLQTALDGKVDDSQVLTNVPANALFTDTNTVYTHPSAHAISFITGLQTALDGKIDDSQVLTNVPSGALFTDTNTVYTHPSAHAISFITGLQTALDGKVDDSQVLTNVPANALFTDTNTTYTSSDFNHDNLTGFVANEHINWTGASAGTIHLTNLPATAITSVQTAVSQVAMLALTTEEGDVVVRSDESKTYMRNAGLAGTMADFTLLATPTDAVASVDGATGVITLNHDNLTGFVANEHIDWSADQGATNIHTGNYTNTVYTLPFTDNSGNWNTAYGWGNHASAGYITGVTNISGYAGTLIGEDNRTIAPNEVATGRLKVGFTSWNNNNTSPYADFFHFRAYGDSSGGADNLLMLKKSGQGIRLWQQTFGSSTAYSSYVDIWDTGTLTTTNKANYDTAYSWGNPSGVYLPLTSGTLTGALTLSVDTTDALNFSANSTSDARGISFNGRTALSADYNDGWLRLNQQSEFSNGLYTPGSLRVDGSINVQGSGNVTASGFISGNITVGSNAINNSSSSLYLQYYTPAHGVDFMNGKVFFNSSGNATFDGTISSGAITSSQLKGGELGNPQITRNGLTYYVDFNNKACISGTSSTEVPVDLGPNNYLMSLYGGANFEYKDGIGCYYFDGSADHIQINNFVVANAANSIEIWHYAVAQSGWETWWDSGNERPLLGTNGSSLKAYPSSATFATINTGKWYHVVWAFGSNSDLDVFVNGVRVSEALNWGSAQRTGTFQAWLGGDSAAETTNGYIAIARAYDRQLTAADVLQNYNAEVGTFATVTPDLGIVQQGGSVTVPSLTTGGAVLSGSISVTSTSTSAIYLSGNNAGVYFTGGNNRIFFSGHRAMEGDTTGGTLQIGEGYTTTLVQSNLDLSSGHTVRINGTEIITSGRDLTNIGNITQNGISLNASVTPVKYTYNGNTGTYNPTVTYINQNNTSGSTANGMFLEMGRLSDSGSAEVRHFVVGARGGQIQFKVDGSANTTSIGSLRTPIFYDSDNTGYFLNPSASGGTALKTIGDWRQDTDTWSGEVAGKMQYHSNSWYLQYSSELVFRNASAVNTMTTSTAGVMTVSSSSRAPVFYDSNDTAYFADPHSTSNLNTVSIDNTLYVDSDSHLATDGNGRGVFVSYSSSSSYRGYWDWRTLQLGNNGANNILFGNTAVGGHGKFYVNATGISQSGGTSGTLAFSMLASGEVVKEANERFTIKSHSNGWVGGMRLTTQDGNTTFQIHPDNNGTLMLDGVWWFNGQVRAPAFYDSNNTSYFLNPSASGGNALKTIGDWRQDTDTWSGEVAGKMQYHSNNWYIQYNTETIFRNASAVNTMTMNSSGDMTVSASSRAPIFYDSNDTAYYVNPNGQSRIEQLNINGGIVSSTNIGLKVSSATNGSTTMSQATHAIGIGPASTRTGPSAPYYGGIAFNGLYNYGGGTGYDAAAHVWVGAKYHDTPGSERSKFVIGVKSGTGTTATDIPVERFSIDYVGSAVVTGDVRAPLFYDTDNSSYFLNPATDSNTGSRMRGGIIFGPNTTWSSELAVGTNGNVQSYACVATTNGNLHLDAQAGQNLYLGWYTTTATYVGGDIRATEYYDRNDTAYYVNPAGTSAFNTITAAGNVTAYSDRRIKENIEPITNALSKVQQLNGVTFNRIDLSDKTKRYAGLIAQDIEVVLPEAVEGTSTLRVDYNATIGLLVESIKELKAEVDELKERLKNN